ncbi:MAG: phosphoglycerate dehydrogenase [Bacteroidetes bacterium]|nr:phosphoglycerate dehydrogenase [Bacteroidota bacterium]MDA0874660.1 phosphoglycerate dehydrogenase [Bacteroidota bacterium]
MTSSVRPRVLLTDSVHPACYTMLEEAGIEAVNGSKWAADQISEACSDFDGWIIRSGTTIGKEWIEKAGKLKVIGRAGVGVDNVDLSAATRRGVLVLNAPAGNTLSTAEHTMAMLLSIARSVPAASASIKSGQWDRKTFMGAELHGKTLGILGLGKIGKEVAVRAQAFGMRVIGSDPMLTPEAAERMGIDLVDVDTIIAESDYITVHTPLVAATRGLFNDETLGRCKRGVGIINCARGGIVDESALLRALESGQVSGAGLDVFTSEPPVEELRPLLDHPRTVCTPHIAASTEEAQEKVARQVTEQVIHALRGEPVLTAVNAMAIRLAAQSEVQPYLALAEQLGRAARQLAPGRTSRLKVRCHGDVPRRYMDVIHVSALKGFLQEGWSEPVNLVNALVLAQEAGLTVDVETFHPGDSYSNLIGLELSGAEGSFTMTGSLFGGSDPRIVSVDGYDVELRLNGRMLLYRNQDRPGMLAAVGTLLAEAGINIGSMALGRNRPGEEALTVIAVDSPLPETVLDAVSGLEGVHRVSMLEFMP